MTVAKTLRSALASATYLAHKSVVTVRYSGWRSFYVQAKRKLFPPKVYAPAWSKTYSAEALAFAAQLDFTPDELQRSRALVAAHSGRLAIHTVNWFIPPFKHVYYGGPHTILRFAAGFAQQHGVRNTFVVVGDPTSAAAEVYLERMRGAFPALADSQVVVLRFEHELAAVPPADACVATFWSTAYSVLKVNRTRRKFYFLQDFEPVFYPAGSASAQVEATYRFGFYGLANTVTLKQTYEEQYQGQATFFNPCVDSQLFYPPDERDRQPRSQPYTVFFYARPTYWRNGFELGAIALRKVKERMGQRVRIVSAGEQWEPADYGLRGVVENLGLLSYRETAQLYRSCDAGLVMMFTHHPSYLPFELMASGCLVVSNVNNATAWFLKDGENCLLTLPSASCAAETIVRGLEDDQLRRRISAAAQQSIQRHFSDWDGQIAQIYAYMCDPAALTDVTCDKRTTYGRERYAAGLSRDWRDQPKMQTATELAATVCRLDQALVKDGMLHLSGWAISFGDQPVDGFKVSAAGVELSAIEAERGRASPDIQMKFPDLPDSEHARFTIRAPLSAAQQDQLKDQLVIVTPLVAGRLGVPVPRLIDPSLPTPSKEYIERIGDGNFVGISNEFLGIFIGLAGLQPTEQVLDVGCGVGRMAYSLAYYLKPPGRYEGFDIMAPLVQWASETISARYPNFTFRHVNIANQAYNPTGTIRSVDFVFPYPDDSFDFVFLTSVFTHMFPADVRQYLDEIRRVLKPGGRCLTTCFLLNEESQRLLAEGKGQINLVHTREEYFTANPANPEHAIGFSEPVLLKWIEDRGLTIAGKYYGAWCGRTDFVTSHDLLVFEKSR